MGFSCGTLQIFKHDDSRRLEIWLLIVWYKFMAFRRNMQTPLQDLPKRHKMPSHHFVISQHSHEDLKSHTFKQHLICFSYNIRRGEGWRWMGGQREGGFHFGVQPLWMTKFKITERYALVIGSAG